jgi:hypothetical protein
MLVYCLTKVYPVTRFYNSFGSNLIILIGDRNIQWMMLIISVLDGKTTGAHMIMNRNTYFQLSLIVPAIALLGLTGPSIVDGKGGHNNTDDDGRIAPRVYNSQDRRFDRPWPFGPESTH